MAPKQSTRDMLIKILGRVEETQRDVAILKTDVCDLKTFRIKTILSM